MADTVDQPPADEVELLGVASDAIGDEIDILSAEIHSSLERVVSVLSSNNVATNEAIGGSITELRLAVERGTEDTLVDSGIFLALFGAVIAGIVGYVSNLLHWKYVNRAEKREEAAKLLLGLLSSIEETSIRYWLTDPAVANVVECAYSEIRIKSEFKNLSRYLSQFCTSYSVSSQGLKDLQKFGVDVYEAVTGGDFESQIRKSSRGRANGIYGAISKMRARVFSLQVKCR